MSTDTQTNQSTQSTTATLDYTKLESPSRDLVSRFVYAALKDITNDNGEDLYPAVVYENLDNYVLEKDLKKKLKAVFSVSVESQQIIVRFMQKIVSEINSIEVSPDDSLEIISEKISNELFDPMFPEVFRFTSGFTFREKSELNNIEESKRYFTEILSSQMKSSQFIKNNVISVIMKCIKKFSKDFAAMAWYRQMTFNKEVCLGIVRANGFSNELIDDLISNIRIKKKTSRKSKKSPGGNAKKTTEATTETTTDTTTDTTTETTETVTDESVKNLET